MKKFKMPLPVMILMTTIAVILHITFRCSIYVSDFFNDSISSYCRLILAKITNVFPFSLAELLLLSTPVLVIILTFIIIKKYDSATKRLRMAIKIIFSVSATIYILFVITFAPAYSCTPVSEKLNIDNSPVSTEELYNTLSYVTDKVNEFSKKTVFEKNGASELPYDYTTLSKSICESFEQLYSSHKLQNTYTSNIKTLLISPVMTYTHISGVYSFFTGEANLNTNYPDYVCAFSASHELAHQRGFAREDEANFIAYLVCIQSNDEYLKYSGYLSMFNYLSSALRNADYELYKDAVSSLCDEAKRELMAYSTFFEKYQNNVVSSVSNTVNDAYLKLQGTDGVKSYGLVVDLAVSYHKTHS